jgi:hypothetical protein
MRAGKEMACAVRYLIITWSGESSVEVLDDFVNRTPSRLLLVPKSVMVLGMGQKKIST